MADIIDGKAIAKAIKADVKAKLDARDEAPPHIVAVQVGEDAASLSYVRNQARQAERVGMGHRLDTLSAETTADELDDHLHRLGTDPDVSAIMLQTPLPSHLDPRRARASILPQKDVEAVTVTSAGLLVANRHRVAPCTAVAAVRCLIEAVGDQIHGMDVCVVGRSEIVGRPLTLLLLHANATVTLCHRNTVNLKEKTLRADAVITAVGLPNLIRADMVKPGSIVIDVGTNWLEDEKRLVGDVAYDEVAAVASKITPVPGGVGPVTVAVLLENALRLESFRTQEPAKS